MTRRINRLSRLTFLVVVLGCWSASAQEAQPTGKIAFLVAVNDYEHAALPDAKFRERDVEELAKVLAQLEFDVMQVRGSEAKREGFAAALNQFLAKMQRVRPDDVVLVFLSGAVVLYPTASGDQLRPTFACADSDPQDLGTLMTLDWLVAELRRRSRSRYNLVCVDGAYVDPRPPAAGHVAVRLPDPPPVVSLLLSCEPGQRPYESISVRHGVFVHEMLRGLAGAARHRLWRDISWAGLVSHLMQRVPLAVKELTEDPQAVQRPIVVGTFERQPVLLAADAEPPKLSLPPEPLRAPFGQKEAEAAQQAWAAYLGHPVQFKNKIGMTMVLIPPGQFLMGSPDDEPEREPDEGPQHPVSITRPFYMAATEVTQAQWFAVMGTRPWQGQPDTREGATLPATYISWHEAVEFCRRLSQSDEWSYRLPTEAEWEYACRAGSQAVFCFGDSQSELDQYAWYVDNTAKQGRRFAHPVGQKRPNAFGLYDVHGNAREWCEDWYDEKFYSTPTATQPNPINLKPSEARTLRGGSWLGVARAARCADRHYFPPETKKSWFGFRVVAEPDELYEARLAAHGVVAPGTGSSGPAGRNAPPLARAPFSAEQARQLQQLWADYLGVPVRFVNKAGIAMVLIPPGEFTMGYSPEEEQLVRKNFPYIPPERIATSLPPHRVQITKPFYMAEHEVTKGQFAQFVSQTKYQTETERKKLRHAGFNPQTGRFELPPAPKFFWNYTGFPQTVNHPVVYVTWNDAKAFCRWLSQQEGATYRLPTEAEWEFACRAGTTTVFFFGTQRVDAPSYLNSADQSAKATWTRQDQPGFALYNDKRPFTAPIRSFRPNPFGLYDMLGNVWEYCEDAFGPNFYARSPEADPVNSDASENRSVRGGSYGEPALPSGAREYRPQQGCGPFLGFRVVQPVNMP